MRRFLTKSFILLALVVGAAGAAPTAHAQLAPGAVSASSLSAPAAPANTGNNLITNAGVTNSFSAPAVTGTVNSGTYGNAADAAAASRDAALSATAGITSSSVTSSAATDAAAQATAAKIATDNGPKMSDALAGVMTWIMSLFAWLLGVAVITLDSAVYYTVITMGDYVKHLSAVGVTWRILRDIGNIALIFGFLAVGITTILNVNWYGSGKKMLPMMLVAAIFLNFSLFISEAIIDTGNLFATQFYTQINGGNLPTGTLSFGDIANAGNNGIAGKIMNQLGLATIYSSALKNDKVLSSGTSIFIGFMSIILFIVAAFVMFSLAFVLIARFVALIFLIILAPVGFAGLAVPMLAKRAGDWWDQLFKQTVTAPILLLMLYIALAIITDANFLGFGPAGDWAGFVPNKSGVITNLSSFASILLSFIVAMGLLIAVVIQSKNLSAFGAAGASKLAGKLTFGATAWVGTKTVGLGSHYAARAIRTSGIGGSRTGRFLATTFDRGAKASFDVRGATIGGGLKGIGIDAGKAVEGGYQGQRGRTIKAHEGYAKSIGDAFEERGPTGKDIVAVAEEKRKATEAQTAAKTAKEAAEQTVNEQNAEIERLKRLQAGQAFPDKEIEDKIATEQKMLETSKKGLTTATENLKNATVQFESANKRDAGGVMKDNIKNRKEAYAGNISTQATKNPIMWTVNLGMYGPGGAQAAKKIKDSVKEKSKEKKVYEAIKKAVEEEAKEKTGEETPKPPEANKTKPSDT